LIKSFKRIKDIFQGKSYLFERRASEWLKIRKAYLQEFSTCAVCGGGEKLEVHHKIPFQYRPDLELELSNLITLCESKKRGVICHLFFGHLGNYRDFNMKVVEDSEIWRAKLKR
jgi:hypothetical protein